MLYWPISYALAAFILLETENMGLITFNTPGKCLN